jgi:transcriptional regulator with XRE-family HTH domain
MSANAIEQGGDLRAARRALGLSQQRVAELARCSVSYVRLLESGYQPEGGSDVLRRIAAVLRGEGGGA